MIARSPSPHATVQVCLLRLHASRAALRGSVFDVLEVRRTPLCRRGGRHRLFGHTLERLGITSGTTSDAMLNTGFYALAKSPVV